MNNVKQYNKLKMFDMEQINDYGFFCDIEEPYTNNDNNKKLVIKNNKIYTNKLYSICENNEKKSDSILSTLSTHGNQEFNELKKRFAFVVGILCISIYIIVNVI